MRITLITTTLLAGLFSSASGGQDAARGYHLKLNAALDRPQDGYCLDVVGSGQHVRFDMPLTTHNCKGPHFYADEEVEYRSDGTLYFPAYQGCVTVMGVNQHALPKNALMLKPCGVEEPFLNAPKFQKFRFNRAQQVQLVDSELCLTAGKISRTTYSSEHTWRALFMEECTLALKELSQWKLVKPEGYQ